MFPFLIIIKKNNESNVILSMKGKDKKTGVSEKECLEIISKTQLNNNFSKNIRKLQINQRFILEIWDSKNKNSHIPRYTLIVVDSGSKNLLEEVKIF